MGVGPLAERDALSVGVMLVGNRRERVRGPRCTNRSRQARQSDLPLAFGHVSAEKSVSAA